MLHLGSVQGMADKHGHGRDEHPPDTSTRVFSKRSLEAFNYNALQKFQECNKMSLQIIHSKLLVV